MARLNAACGIDPWGGGSCFGVSDPGRLRPTNELTRKPKGDEKTVTVDLGAIRKERDRRGR